MTRVDHDTSVIAAGQSARRRSGWRRSGTHYLEYATLIAVAAAALFAMSNYIYRGLAGKWRQVGDGFGYGRQYEPGKTK